MNKETLKEKVCKAIDDNKEVIIELAETIYKNPELGYKEKFATEKVFDVFKKLDLKDLEKDIAITGCLGVAGSDKNGPNIAVMGELDSVVCMDHPDSNELGAIHACGHNNQIAAMVGAAFGIMKSEVLGDLDGKVTFMAVPAEEYIEIDYRSELIEKGEIKFIGGKQELIHRGYFDNVDIAMMIHSFDTQFEDKKIIVGPTANGFVGKKIKFLGKEAHAGGAPYEGINALNAAMLAINNVHANRETFKEEDMIRFHPIITKGGDVVNIVPAEVKMESYVRGKTVEGIEDANKKINRSLIAGAKAVGANVEINEIPGYFPLKNYKGLDDLFYENSKELIDEEEIGAGFHMGGSLDMGDLSQILPTLHPFVGGIEGGLHTREFKLVDKELAYITPAKIMAMTVIDLLYEKGKEAKNILNEYKPPMTKEEYLDSQEEKSRLIKE